MNRPARFTLRGLCRAKTPSARLDEDQVKRIVDTVAEVAQTTVRFQQGKHLTKAFADLEQALARIERLEAQNRALTARLNGMLGRPVPTTSTRQGGHGG